MTGEHRHKNDTINGQRTKPTLRKAKRATSFLPIAIGTPIRMINLTF
ncbi:MAG TPA: hypothetical protein PLM26_12345 [Saprospiraceae bacterium]|nr:hypothetical protein [Saprospiraceae bacterium]